MSEQTECQYDVFISYSHADRRWVWDELLPRIEGAGLCVCIDDRDFELGKPILTNIEQAVNKSRQTLLVLTPAWLESQWTDFESLLVGTVDPVGRRSKLIPLMLKPCQPPARIAMLTYADFTNTDDLTSQFRRLLLQLQCAASPIAPFEELSNFIAGPPIMHPRYFYGRARELKRLYNLWKRRPLQNAAVIGPRRSGKTSLLLYLKSIGTAAPGQLRPDQHAAWPTELADYRWVFVDFQDWRLSSRGSLLNYLLTQLELPVPNPCNLENFMDVVSRNLRSPAVILLDEVGVALQRYQELDEPFWESLRSLATNQVGGNLAFVLAAHEALDQLACHSNIGSPFFNIFGYVATLGPLTDFEARKLIASSPMPFPPSDVEWILTQSRRWPLLLQILCRERLVSLEDGETDDIWRRERLDQMAPFQPLFG